MLHVKRLYFGTGHADDILARGFTNKEASGYSSTIDINGIHTTRSLKVAQYFANRYNDGAVLLCQARFKNPLILTGEDIERRGVTLVKHPDDDRYVRGSRKAVLDYYASRPASRRISPKHIQDLLDGKGNFRISFKVMMEVALNQISYATHGIDAVIWPLGGGYIGLEHAGEHEITVLNPKCLRAVRKLPAEGNVRTASAEPVVYYHGTSEIKAKKILKDGYLRWSRVTTWGKGLESSKGYVYLTSDLGDAVRYANSVTSSTQRLAVVEVRDVPLERRVDEDVFDAMFSRKELWGYLYRTQEPLFVAVMQSALAILKSLPAWAKGTKAEIRLPALLHMLIDSAGQEKAITLGLHCPTTRDYLYIRRSIFEGLAETLSQSLMDDLRKVFAGLDPAWSHRIAVKGRVPVHTVYVSPTPRLDMSLLEANDPHQLLATGWKAVTGASKILRTASVRIENLRLYHGTIRSRALKIKKDGFLEWKPSTNWDPELSSVEGHVYLTKSVIKAFNTAEDISFEQDISHKIKKEGTYTSGHFVPRLTTNSPCIVVVNASLSAVPDEDTLTDVLIARSHLLKGPLLQEFWKEALSVFKDLKKEGLISNDFQTVNTVNELKRTLTRNVLRNGRKPLKAAAPIPQVIAKRMTDKHVLSEEIQRRLILAKIITSLAVRGKVPVSEIYAFGTSVTSKSAFRRPQRYEQLRQGQRLL